MTEPDQSRSEDKGKTTTQRVRWRGPVGLVAALLVILTGSIAFAAWFPGSAQGQKFIERHVNGLQILRYGNLQIEGVSGDIWHEVRARRLALKDRNGVWAEAVDARMSWDWKALLGRQFHARTIAAKSLTVYRPPVLTAPTKPVPNPVSVRIDDITTDLVTKPALSVREGRFKVNLGLTLPIKSGPLVLKLRAQSLMHPGDHAVIDLESGAKGRLRGNGDIFEARGGALAGLLGFADGQPLVVKSTLAGDGGIGHLDIRSSSGLKTPLLGQLSWNKALVSGQGVWDLSASRWTRDFASRLGPTARFDLTGHGLGRGGYDIRGRLETANAVLVTSGPIEPGKVRTRNEGLKLSLDIRSLERAVTGLPIGRTQTQGRLTGGLADWNYTGTASLTDIRLDPLNLSNLSGPLILKSSKKGLAISVQAQGQNIVSNNEISRLLGQNPKAEGQFLRLSDGRFLIEDLSIQGDGVTATAQGSRSLFGGLDLKGHAVVQELGRWKAGVQGAAEGDWTASQARAQADWKFSAQLKTRQIQTPIPELSRLLGGQPNLEAHGIFDGHQIIFSDAKIAGSALSAKGSGHLGLDGRLAVDLDWTARGPFGVGPVEVTGNASGKGMIGGNVARPELQLGAHFDQVALPDFALTDASLTLVFKRTQDGGDGTFNLRANSQYGPGYVSSGFNFVPGGLQLSALDANLAGVTASGDVSLAGNGPSRANLVLDVGPGAFLLRGQAHGTLRIEDGSSSALTHLDLRLSNLVPRAYNIAVGDGHLVADGPYNALNFTFSGNGASASGPWSLGLGGLAEQKEGRLTLVATGDGKLAKTAFTMLEPARIVLGNSRTDVDARLGIGSGMATVTARFGQDGGQARGQFSALDLRLVNQDLTGKVDGTVELSGKGARLDGTMDVRLLDARTIGAPVAQGLSGKMMVLLRDSQMEVRADLANQLGLTSHLNMALPAEASAAPLRLAVNRQKPISGTFDAEGEVKPLWDLLVGRDRTLSGIVDAKGRLSGSLGDPRIEGNMRLSGGRFGDGATGLDLQNIDLTASLENSTVNLVRAQADDGHNGQLSGTGRISLVRNGASDLEIQAIKFRLLDNETATIIGSGKTRLVRGGDGRVKLQGALNIDRADIAANPPVPSGVVPMEVIELNRPQSISLATTKKNASSRLAVDLDVDLTANRGLFVKGRGLDVEFSLDAHVGGTTSSPVLTGRSRVIRGDYDFSGKRFTFDQRSTVDLSTAPEKIKLNLTATRDDTSLTAVVKITGSAARPRIDLSSTPSLPDDEIMSQVLFGASASQLSPLEAAQLAAAVSALASGGGFDVIGGLRNLAGLDRLAFAGGGSGDLTVAGGKYLTDDVYLELIGGGREGPAAQVEWRVQRNLSLVSRLSSQGGSKLSVKWRRDY